MLPSDRSAAPVLPGRDWLPVACVACHGDLVPSVRAILRGGYPEDPAVIQYLQNNRTGLADYYLLTGFRDDPSLRGLAAAEANIDKVIAHRMAKRGIGMDHPGSALDGEG